METPLITSVQNPRVKQVVLLQQKSSERRKQGLFVVEGARELSHCLSHGYEADSLFVCDELLPSSSSLQEVLYRKALSGAMDDRQSVQLLTILMRSAGTDAPPETKEAERPQTSVNIAFNIPKIAGKKFAKLSACAQNKVVEPPEDQ